MASRLELQSKFEELLGSRNVYYQPPESIKMSYTARMPTAGGKKKKGSRFKKKSEISAICSTLTIFVQSNKKRMSIARMLPGRGTPQTRCRKSPIKHTAKINAN